MSRTEWHILREDGALTLTRRLPVRFDLSVEAVLPRCGKQRLAVQVRQDMWRLLQRLPGFSPVVRVEEVGQGLRVIAGGQVARKPFPKAECEAKLREMLTDGKNRSRWVAYGRRVCYE